MSQSQLIADFMSIGSHCSSDEFLDICRAVLAAHRNRKLIQNRWCNANLEQGCLLMIAAAAALKVERPSSLYTGDSIKAIIMNALNLKRATCSRIYNAWDQLVASEISSFVEHLRFYVARSEKPQSRIVRGVDNQLYDMKRALGNNFIPPSPRHKQLALSASAQKEVIQF